MGSFRKAVYVINKTVFLDFLVTTTKVISIKLSEYFKQGTKGYDPKMSYLAKILF